MSPRKPVTGGTDKDWPASVIESRPVADLVPYARNARTHTPEQVGKIARSIGEFGWTNPILVTDENTIVAGHGRLLAAQLLEMENVPVVVARGWSDAQQRAYVIADNKLATDAGWDRELLEFEFAALGELDFDLSLTGFEDEESTRGDGVSRVDVPPGVNFVWALVGVPLASTGMLSKLISELEGVDGAVVELSDDFVEAEG